MMNDLDDFWQAHTAILNHQVIYLVFTYSLFCTLQAYMIDFFKITCWSKHFELQTRGLLQSRRLADGLDVTDVLMSAHAMSH